MSDILYHIKNVSEIELLAGCTQIKELSSKSLSLRLIPELLTIERRELYIDIGSAVTLSDILLKEATLLPEILRDAIKTIATARIRNIATLGGNICAKDTRHTLYSPLLALNAKLEIKTPDETIFIPFAEFKGSGDKQILTKVRIPLDDWEIAIFRRVGPKSLISPLSAGFSFLASTQRNMISNIKIVFAGNPLFYSPEFENRIIGAKLPLTEKLIDDLIEQAKELYEQQNSVKDDVPSFFLKTEFLNLLRFSLEQLS